MADQVSERERLARWAEECAQRVARAADDPANSDSTKLRRVASLLREPRTQSEDCAACGIEDCRSGRDGLRPACAACLDKARRSPPERPPFSAEDAKAFLEWWVDNEVAVEVDKQRTADWWTTRLSSRSSEEGNPNG